MGFDEHWSTRGELREVKTDLIERLVSGLREVRNGADAHNRHQSEEIGRLKDRIVILERLIATSQKTG